MIKNAKIKNKILNFLVYIILIILAIIWLIPVVWVVLTSLRAEPGSFVSYFIPKNFTLENYIKLFTQTEKYNFPKWFLNTLLVACCSCVLTTVISLATAYVFSRMRFKMRKTFMNIALVIGMFPAFMSTVAIYHLIKSIHLQESLLALILIYSSSASLQFYIAKGFFDTIPKSLDEAARLDGATNAQIFYKVTLPLSKPILTYTALTAFMSPWMDFIFARVIMGTNYENYTVAIGLFTFLNQENIRTWFTSFAAGSVCVALPITVLFIFMQKFYVEGIAGGAVKG